VDVPAAGRAPLIVFAWRNRAETATAARRRELAILVKAAFGAGRGAYGCPTGRYLSFAERGEIALLRAQDVGVREIARRIGRDPRTISRELRRNAAARGGKRVYRALVARWKAQQAARRPKTAELADNDRLREYVQERLSGSVRRPDGTIVAGPKTPAWRGLNKPHRQDRRWAAAWSPEQISNRLKVEFPDDESMRISHEAIYQALVIEGRGALKRELVACLRTGRALREPRARSRNKPQGHVTTDVVISERPAEAAVRAVPGHWEGDLIIGTGRSAIGTLVERSSRSTILIHLPRIEGWGEKPPVKNGPSPGGYGAVATNAALTASVTQLPGQLRKTLTWDRGKELSGHARFALDTGTRVFFADPHSPWQRPTNENTNGLLRQYFPKGAFPPTVWSAFARPRAEQRIRRLLALPGHPGLQDAARHLGIRHAALLDQIRQIETTTESGCCAPAQAERSP
jgi:IS30 family transposase